jgi:hypothetical protein
LKTISNCNSELDRNHITEMVNGVVLLECGTTIVCGIAKQIREEIFVRDAQTQCFEPRGSGPALWIRMGFNAYPDPAFYFNADPDPGSQTNANPCGPGS